MFLFFILCLVLFSVLLMSVSKYFTQKSQKHEDESGDLVDTFICHENNLVSQLINLNYGENVKFIYNPLNYASDLHKAFLKKFLNSKKKVLFLGINPGPWGMCQTGVSIQFIIYKSFFCIVRI